MKKLSSWIILAAGLLCGHWATADDSPTDAVFQYSTINALLDGLYDGDLTIKHLSDYGNMGLGTVNGVDGELIVLDGEFYHVKADGHAYPLTPERETPFAVVKYFTTDHSEPLPAKLDYAALQKHLDKGIKTPNFFQAIRIDGTFSFLKVRSIPKQSKPYRPLAEVVHDDQVTFDYENAKGSLIGFRTPEYMKGLNVPGYHFHFLSENRKFGGHVLALVTTGGTIQFDEAASFQMALPEVEAFAELNLGASRKKELDKVEKGQ
ncbi:MAG: acetolactate decarboxylase [Candidatus Competibacteraceae bacterium]|jgi:acetolactate decarboxylase|nr:acetolactate decarboxylase [Candidatus Competibacteraceae bacterium]